MQMSVVLFHQSKCSKWQLYEAERQLKDNKIRMTKNWLIVLESNRKLNIDGVLIVGIYQINGYKRLQLCLYTEREKKIPLWNCLGEMLKGI